MRIRSLWLSCIAIVFLGACGCGSKVHQELSGELTPGESAAFSIDAPKSQQKVKVQVTSDADVTVIVALKKEVDNDHLKVGGKHLGESAKTTSASLEVTVPEGEEFSVIIKDASKKTSYKLKIDSI